ncbi:protein phosphatase 2C domain-containing protein [Fimbriiglobus ruber]|uniref:PPM-type phosphatase domain-containing protein n=1 Tax=Fimbriiglobus ruber TaxID=1908690 RepID=A0A225E7V6_9BACT|nr:protein phosphatase 2C domain-containing protein [Fimbriiglobus ruber]OWK46848.1 hypothetical protein FRUB_00547 [Fimbriiglobus ruber]
MSGVTTAGPVVWGAASLPKIGNRADENEDAIAAAPAGLRFAVADGATEGWHSKAWADRLARAFVVRPPAPSDFAGWLTEARTGWDPPARSGPASWYAEEKEIQGAYATLLGVRLIPRAAGGWAWKAVAVGDSCLFVVRGERHTHAFPIDNPEVFGSSPLLVASTPAGSGEPDWMAGQTLPGDLLVLATDAVAAWLLQTAADATPAWPRVRTALNEPDAPARAAGLRELLGDAQAAKNDDASMVAVLVPEPAEPPR